MAAPDAPAVPVLRSAVVRSVERRGLRAVSVEVGMSHTGLLAFINGGEPRTYTLTKLRAWYVKHGAALDVVDLDALEGAVRLLLNGVPDEHQGEGSKRIMAAVRETYKAAGLPAPKWARG